MKLKTLSLLALSISQSWSQNFFWDDKSNGQTFFSCPSIESTANNNNRWSQSRVISEIPCPGESVSTRIAQLSNWNVAQAPDSPTASVTLSGSSPLTELRSDVSVSTLTIANTNELEIGRSGNLGVFGGLIQNDGVINLNMFGGRPEEIATLELNANTSLTGNGTILFSDGSNQIISPDPSHTLNIGSDQLVTTSPSSSFFSRLVASFVNNGTITADEGSLQIEAHPKTNNNLIQAVRGGAIRFESVTVENTDGIIRADQNSIIDLRNTTINGGLLDGAGQFNATRNGEVTFNGPLTLGSETTMLVNFGDNLFLSGTLTNEGLIRLFSGFSGSNLEIIGDSALLGEGEILFENGGPSLITSSVPSDVLTIGPDQLVTASPSSAFVSRLVASFVNNGTITADEGGLQIDTNPKTNNNLIQAVDGGAIRFESVTVENTDGIIRADQNSIIDLRNTTINGGLLDGAGQFNATRNGEVTFNGPLTLGSETTMLVNFGDNLFLSGTLTNEGLIRLFSGFSGSNLEIIGDSALLGEGELLFENGGPSLITSSAPSDVLTIGPDQLVTASPSSGFPSRLVASFVNNGIITADEGGLQIDTNPKTNNNLIQAVGGGVIRFDSVTVENTNGIIRVDPGSTLELLNATIDGGVLEGGGRITLNNNEDSTFNGPLTIGSETHVLLNGSDTLFLTGTITNNGLIEMFRTFGDISLEIMGDTTLQGGRLDTLWRIRRSLTSIHRSRATC